MSQDTIIQMPEREKSIYSQTTAKNLIYEPSDRKPSLVELVDRNKTIQLEAEIRQSKISDSEKEFLILAAQRHNGFYYDLIADYHAHASPEMKRLMEVSGLVIVDFNRAIELGFVKLSQQICDQHSEEYP